MCIGPADTHDERETIVAVTQCFAIKLSSLSSSFYISCTIGGDMNTPF